MTKFCHVCQETKPIESFCLDRSSKDGRGGYCRACRAEWAKAYRERRPRLDYEMKLWSRYGITVEQYDAMLEAQNHRCKICGVDRPAPRRKNFCVDHDHETGEVRGLLCLACNSGLGNFRDDPALLRAAIDYLERSIVRK